MAIYTIGDLHLSFKENKPMSIFGDNWEGHEEKIKEDWLSRVKKEDLVILPGDFSWATYLKDTDEDFIYLKQLPGKKLLLKGNHDYWWSSISKLNAMYENMKFIQNNLSEYMALVLWSCTEISTVQDRKMKIYFE